MGDIELAQVDKEQPERVTAPEAPGNTGKENGGSVNRGGGSVQGTGTYRSRNQPTNPFESQEAFKKALSQFLDSTFFVTFMMVLTFWALFSNDIRVSGAPKEADEAFAVIITIAFFLFVFEILATSFVSPEYIALPSWEAEPLEDMFDTWVRRLQFGSFYFWLDWLATLTLLFEIPWAIGDSLSGGSGVQSAKAVRLVRLVRMVRLVRLVKLYKYAQQAKELQKKKKAQELEASGGGIDDSSGGALSSGGGGGNEVVIEESHVGAAMADLTNKRVLILILVMLIVVPVLSVSETDLSGQTAHDVIQAMAADPMASSAGLQKVISYTANNLPLIFLAINGVQMYKDSTAFDAAREIDKTEYNSELNGVTVDSIFDSSAESAEGANFSIGTTIFVMVLLLVGTYAFSTDVETLVIEPIEKMVSLVKKISADPLGVNYDSIHQMEGFVAGMETTVLLTTIAKIGGLMRVGFGSAGAAVIGNNLRDGTGKLNLFGAGTTITSIFGFCDVRNFTDTTECLQEEVMLFVNRIAHILHQIIVQCSGAANKNIGDAFLLTWKLEDSYSSKDITKLADQALLSFCKAHIELCKYQDFICNFTVAATQRLFKRFPTYKVRLGTGLHVGWAIEGAIGSNRKIDATYLSPHVNMSEFLESSTKTYGVALLISEPFYKLLSPAAAKYCRQVDRLKRNVREAPLGIYAYDTDLTLDFNEIAAGKGKNAVQLAKEKLMNAMGKAGGGRRASVAGVRPSAAALAQMQANKEKGSKTDLNLPTSTGSSAVAAAVTKKASTTGEATDSKERAGGGSADRHGGSSRPAGGKKALESKKGPAMGGSKDNSTSGRGPASSVNRTGPNDGPDVEKGEGDAKKESSPTITIPKYTEAVWVEDIEIVELRHKISDKFRTIWAGGVEAYVKGDWQKARDIFEQTLKMSSGEDGPSKFLISIIDENQGAAPEGWPGYREVG